MEIKTTINYELENEKVLKKIMGNVCNETGCWKPSMNNGLCVEHFYTNHIEYLNKELALAFRSGLSHNFLSEVLPNIIPNNPKEKEREA